MCVCVCACVFARARARACARVRYLADHREPGGRHARPDERVDRAVRRDVRRRVALLPAAAGPTAVMWHDGDDDVA